MTYRNFHSDTVSWFYFGLLSLWQIVASIVAQLMDFIYGLYPYEAS